MKYGSNRHKKKQIPTGAGMTDNILIVHFTYLFVILAEAGIYFYPFARFTSVWE